MIKKMIYFNHNASSYPKPEGVISEVIKQVSEVPFDTYRSGFKSTSVVDKCRLIIADLFSVKNPCDIVFTSGSTEALNLALFGLQSPKHIITSAIEHNSVLRPLKTMEKNNGVALSIVGCDKHGFVDPQDIKKEINKDTTAIVINHCSNVTGSIQDLQLICDLAHENGLLCIVDASQSAGAINININETPVDMLAFTGHKSLYATTGIGGLYIRPELNINPLKVGGTGIRSNYLYQPQERPIIYEAGTHNSIGLASLIAGVEYVQNEGIENILKQKIYLHNYIINRLLEIEGVNILGGIDTVNKIPVINFSINNMDVDDISYILAESFGINIRAGLHCAPLIHHYINSYPAGTVRISFSHLNTIDEANILVNAITQIAQTQTL